MVVSVPKLDGNFIHGAVAMQPPGTQPNRSRKNQHQTFSLSPKPIVMRWHCGGSRMGVGHAKTTLMACTSPTLRCKLFSGVHQKSAAAADDGLLL